MTAAEHLFELLDEPQSGFGIVCRDRQTHAGELAEESRRVARLLQSAGLRCGDRIGLWLPNGHEWFVVAMACSRLGIAILALNPRLGSKEIGSLLSLSACKALVLSAEYRNGYCLDILAGLPASLRPSLSAVVYAGRVHQFDGGDNLSLHSLNDDPCSTVDYGKGKPVDPEAPFLLLSTSGTTGLPKLVQHAQQRIVRHIHDVVQSIDLARPDSKMLLGIPMCGAYGFTITMASLAAGVPLHVMEDFDPANAVGLIRQCGITHMMGTDDMLDKMLGVTDDPLPLPSLRMFGHANFTPSLRDFPERAEARGVRLRGAYGLSETLATVAAQSLDAGLDRRAQGGGQLVCRSAEFRIRDTQTDRLIENECIGEIEIRTPNVMLGYLDNPEANRQAFTEDGFLRTGDSGYRAEDGGFTYLSRISDVLRIGGYLVSPAEIEEVIRRDPTVSDCQVVAIDLPEGSRPVAFVVAMSGFDEAKALDSCRSELARYKTPARIFSLDSMPVTISPNGVKIKKSELRERARKLMGVQ